MLIMPDFLTTKTLHLLLNCIQITTIKADHRQNEPEKLASTTMAGSSRPIMLVLTTV